MEVQPRHIKSCKRESNSSIVDRLTQDLFFQILLKLPDVKTLLQCTSVCKTWYYLINSLDFFSTHLNQKALPFCAPAKNSSNNKNDGRLLAIELNCSGFIRYPTDFEARQGFDVDWGLQALLPSPELCSICCCNGLVCFSPPQKDAVILWNPFIKKRITLPPSQLHPPFRYQYDWRQETGLGFDPETNEYKILRIVQLKLHDPTPCVSRFVEVFSLNSASWKKVNTFPSELAIISEDPTRKSVFADGSIHFVGFETTEEQPEGRHVILGFGLDDGAVNKIALPETLSIRTGERKLAIIGYKSSIAAVHEILKEGACDLWVMSEYGRLGSWTMIFRIKDGLSVHAHVFRRGDEMIMVTGRDGRTYSMDLVRKKVNLLTWNWRIIHVSSYVETLALLNYGRHRTIRIRGATKRASRKPAYLKDYNV